MKLQEKIKIMLFIGLFSTILIYGLQGVTAAELFLLGSQVTNHNNPKNNPAFIQSDTDGDGVEDSRDNCPATFNPEKIAFASRSDGNYEIYVTNPTGSNLTRLTNNPAQDYDPTFSPNGSKIAFVSIRDNNTEIYVMNADGSNQTRVTHNLAVVNNPRFSPDGSKIVFDSNLNGNRDIYVISTDGSNLQRLTNLPAQDYAPTFSPDGTKIAFVSTRDNPFTELYLMNADGSNVIRLTNNSLKNDLEPSFSPDGSKIVFVSDNNIVSGSGYQTEIFTINVDGTNLTRLTNDVYSDSQPSFSPDGSKIVFVSNHTGSFSSVDLSVFVMNPDGTNPTQLTNYNLPEVRSPSWGRQADSDGDGIGDACENTAPTINAANAFSVAQNAALMSQPIATVFDNETPVTNLTVSVVGAPPKGISVENIAVNSNGIVTAAVTATCSATLGANTVALQVSDGEFTANANLTVNVTPSRPPVIVLNPFAVLSPPNHSLQIFTVSQMVQSATDDCSGDVISDVTVEKATNDEAVDIRGSGNTARDIIIGADCRSIELRSERSGTGNGRVYTITLKVVDSSGNTTRAAYKVFVPKGSQTAIEDVTVYTVNGDCP